MKPFNSIYLLLIGSIGMMLGGCSSNNNQSAPLTVTDGSNSQMIFNSAPPSGDLNTCIGPFQLTLQDASANTASNTSGSAWNIALSVTGSATLYGPTDTTCTGSVITETSIATLASTSGNFYLKDSATESVTLTANGTGVGLGTKTTSVIITSPWLGTKQLGVAAKYTYGNGVATDSSGNVFITGDTRGDLDGNTLTGSKDSFITKYNSSGTKLWTRLLGAAGTEVLGQAVATDSSGNVFVTGYTDGDLDGNFFAGTSNYFVTKYNSSGTKLWTKQQLGVAGLDAYGLAVATDSSGNVFVTGYTDGDLDGNSLMGIRDFFVTKYNSSGTKQWTQQLGVVSATTEGNGVATDSTGNVFVAGYTNGDLDGNSNPGSAALFVTKYNSSGSKLWTQLLGASSGIAQALGVATDSSGNVFLGGFTRGNLDGNSLTGISDLFVIKYSSSGTKLWTQLLGVSAKLTFGRGIATDSSGNVFIGGDTDGGLDGNSLSGYRDFFVTKYSSSGSKLWTKQLGVAGNGTYGRAVATDPSGNVFIGGETYGGLDGNSLTGTQDLYVTKYNSSGTKQ